MSGVFWKIQEILYSMGTEILKLGPVKAEKIGFKVINLNSEVIAIVRRVGHYKPSFLCHNHKVSVSTGKPMPRPFQNTPYIWELLKN